jgi:hypothetical protein
MAKYVAMMAKRKEETKVTSPDVDDKLCGGWSHRFCGVAGRRRDHCQKEETLVMKPLEGQSVYTNKGTMGEKRTSRVHTTATQQ